MRSFWPGSSEDRAGSNLVPSGCCSTSYWAHEWVERAERGLQWNLGFGSTLSLTQAQAGEIGRLVLSTLMNARARLVPSEGRRHLACHDGQEWKEHSWRGFFPLKTPWTLKSRGRMGSFPPMKCPKPPGGLVSDEVWLSYNEYNSTKLALTMIVISVSAFCWASVLIGGMKTISFTVHLYSPKTHFASMSFQIIFLKK